MSYMTQFFTLFMLSRTSDNTTSQNIVGTNAWAVPPSQILGGPSPQSPPRAPPPGVTTNNFIFSRVLSSDWAYNGREIIIFNWECKVMKPSSKVVTRDLPLVVEAFQDMVRIAGD